MTDAKTVSSIIRPCVSVIHESIYCITPLQPFNCVKQSTSFVKRFVLSFSVNNVYFKATLLLSVIRIPSNTLPFPPRPINLPRCRMAIHTDELTLIGIRSAFSLMLHLYCSEMCNMVGRMYPNRTRVLANRHHHRYYLLNARVLLTILIYF